MSLTIVIPTKARYETLYETIVLSLRLKTVIQVLVLDSSDKELPEKILEIISIDKRIEYLNTPVNFNAVENFNYGIDYIKGRYCLYIGDDDMLIDATDKIMDQQYYDDFDAIACSFPVSYHWPGYTTRNQGEKLGASLILRNFTGETIKYDNPKRELMLVAEKSFLGPQHLPRIYLGIVKTSILKKIQTIHGAVFGGVSPDIYSSALISNHIKSYCLIDYPFIVPGAAPKSTSALGGADKHQGNFKDSNHIRAFKNLEWIDNIPMYYSVETVWAYSMEMALRKLKMDYGINYKNLYKSFSIGSLNFLRILFATSFRQNKSLIKSVHAVGLSSLRANAKNLKALVSKLAYFQSPHKKIVIHKLTNSIDAAYFLEERIREKYFDISKSAEL